jgi:hypothetical protein
MAGFKDDCVLDVLDSICSNYMTEDVAGNELEWIDELMGIRGPAGEDARAGPAQEGGAGVSIFFDMAVKPAQQLTGTHNSPTKKAVSKYVDERGTPEPQPNDKDGTDPLPTTPFMADGSWAGWTLLLAAKERNRLIKVHRLTNHEATDLKKTSRRLKQNMSQERYVKRQRLVSGGDGGEPESTKDSATSDD